jgi:predicted transposase/invertase (TIGR01784 family)
VKINRKNDYAFKRIFGHEDTKDILADFLAVVLATPIEPEELTLVQTELSPEYLADKTSRLDIQVRRSEAHEKMNVELQRADEGNIQRRVLYYWGRSYTGDLKKKQDYETLPKQINIVIVDFDIFRWRDGTKFHGIFHVRDRDEGVLFSDALEIHVLELPKLRSQKSKKVWTSLEGWCLYLDNMEGETMEKIAKRQPLIRRAMTVEDIFTKNEEERRFYELREKGQNDFYNAMSTAKKRGKLEGKEEGIAEGEAKGIATVARAMLEQNLPLEIIKKTTGLSENEIASLRGR